MMRLRRAAAIVALCLLASAATAYAECAWVLWQERPALSKRFALDNYKPGVFRVQRECEAVAENKNQAEAMPRDERGPAHENLTRAGRGAYRSRMRRRRSRSRFEARGV